MDIIKPKLDDQNYHYVELDNQLKCILINNDKIKTSYVALSVAVGYYNDPKDCQGLAHFIEHVIFMGTKKYRNNNYFYEFINNVNGEVNAQTSDTSTTYYYTVPSSYLSKSLDIFSNFFINPLFSQDSIDKEMHAINSEFQKHASTEGTRINAVLKEQVHSNHSYRSFGIGNLKTLNQKKIREEMIEFFEKNYSSNLMHLVILSDFKISTLLTYAYQYFSEIINKHQNIQTIDRVPYTTDFRVIHIIPISQNKILSLLWQIPNLGQGKILDYISYLFGNEGGNSLSYSLKKQNLCYECIVDVFDEDPSFYLYGFHIELTELGLDNIPKILGHIFKYIQFIKSTNTSEIYNELSIIRQINFDYNEIQNNLNFVTDISIRMIKYKPQYVLIGEHEFDTYNSRTDNMLRFCYSFIKKSKSFVIVTAKTKIKTQTKTEKWYNVEYTVTNNIKIEPSIYNFKLPQKNNFISDPTKLIPLKMQKTRQPIKIDEAVWYKFNNKIPKVHMSVTLYSDKIYKTARNCVLFNIYVELLMANMETMLFYANMCSAGLRMNIDRDRIIYYFYGMNDNIMTLVKQVYQNIKQFKITPNEFENAKNKYKTKLINFEYEPAYLLAIEQFENNIYVQSFDNVLLMQELEKVEYYDVKIVNEWNFVGYKIFIYGNISKGDSLLLANNFMIAGNNIVDLNIDFLSDGEEQVYNQKSKSQNTAILMFFEIENIIDDYVLIAMIRITEQYVKERFFTTLRTELQHGYIVKAFVQSYHNTIDDKENILYGIAFLIQSDKSPDILKHAIKLFIKTTYDTIRNDGKLFDETHKTLMQILKTKLTNFHGEYNFYNSIINYKNCHFDIKTKLMDALANIKFKQFMKFFKKYFIDETTRKIRIQKIDPFREQKIEKLNT